MTSSVARHRTHTAYHCLECLCPVGGISGFEIPGKLELLHGVTTLELLYDTLENQKPGLQRFEALPLELLSSRNSTSWNFAKVRPTGGPTLYGEYAYMTHNLDITNPTRAGFPFSEWRHTGLLW